MTVNDRTQIFERIKCKSLLCEKRLSGDKSLQSQNMFWVLSLNKVEVFAETIKGTPREFKFSVTS